MVEPAERAVLGHRRKRYIRAILNKFVKPGVHVVDLGCGRGSLFADIRRVVKGGKITGVDIDARHLEAAKSGAAENSVRLVQLPMRGLPAAVKQKAVERPDTVVAHFALHFEKPKEILSSLADVLPRGGRVIFAVPAGWEGLTVKSEAPSELTTAIEKGLRQLGSRFSQRAANPWANQKAVRKLLSKAGFEVEHFREVKDSYTLPQAASYFKRPWKSVLAYPHVEEEERVRRLPELFLKLGKRFPQGRIKEYSHYYVARRV